MQCDGFAIEGYPLWPLSLAKSAYFPLIQGTFDAWLSHLRESNPEQFLAAAAETTK